MNNALIIKTKVPPPHVILANLFKPFGFLAPKDI